VKTHWLRSLIGASSLAIAALSASLVACSAEDSTVLEPDVAEEAPLGGVDPSIPLEDKYDMELTADERARIDAHYASQGVPEDQVSYRGRVITLEGDMLVDADYLLRNLELVEKGQVHAGGPGFGTGHLARCDGGVPVGNECAAGKFLFFRPWIDSKYYVVVGNEFTPSYYLDLVSEAVTAVENITNDKPTAALFEVKTLAQYNALSSDDKKNYKITVNVSTVACDGDTTLACMEIPLQTTEQTPTGQQTRMRLGRTMGIRQDKILNEAVGSDARAKNLGTIVHELLHSFGVGHMNFENGSFKIYVPGTAKPPANAPSVMWTPRTHANRQHTLQADDIDMMRTLFQPGVGYVHAFSTVNAN
jgi:hypothetical protein